MLVIWVLKLRDGVFQPSSLNIIINFAIIIRFVYYSILMHITLTIVRTGKKKNQILLK